MRSITERNLSALERGGLRFVPHLVTVCALFVAADSFVVLVNTNDPVTPNLGARLVLSPRGVFVWNNERQTISESLSRYVFDRSLHCWRAVFFFVTMIFHSFSRRKHATAYAIALRLRYFKPLPATRIITQARTKRSLAQELSTFLLQNRRTFMSVVDETEVQT